MKREVVIAWPMNPEHNTPYVPAIRVTGGALLFMSGAGPHKPDHKHPHVPDEWNLPDDAAVQARMVLDKITRVVEKAGGKFGHIVKITRYLKNISDQDKVNVVIHEYFGENLPCSTTVQVSAFVTPTMLIEIDAWAVIPDPVPATKAKATRAKATRAKATRPKRSKAMATKAKPPRVATRPKVAASGLRRKS
jgi:enamine deaminase RidA (YjgF/YER057c/UK114 family)